MNVTIIGAGNMGRGIGYRMVEGGNSVLIIDTDGEKARNLVAELSALARSGVSVVLGDLEKSPLGEVVILALPYGMNKLVAKDLGKRLEHKVVVDVANPMNATFDGIQTDSGTSSAEEVAAIVPHSASVIKAFNTTFSSTLVEGKVAGVPLDVLLAGDSAEAKKTLSKLVKEGGLVPVDTGELRRARELESVGSLHITMQSVLNYGFGSAIKIIAPK
jgi:NADPH-dependent F420 reductase